MSYIDKHLLEDEVVSARANRTNWMYFNEILWLFVILLYFLYLRFVLNIVIKESSLATVPLLGVWLIFFLSEIVRDFSIELVVTNRRIIGRTGIFKIKTIDIPLDNVDNVQINCSFIGRALKYGTITIESKSDAYQFRNLRKPFKLKDKIYSANKTNEEEA